MDQGNLFCLQCNHTFSEQNKLNYHLFKIHGAQVDYDSNNYYTCESCDYITKEFKNLKRHKKLIHLKVRKLFCDFCGKGFLIPSDLKRHKLIHGSRNFECGYCKLCFVSYSKLKCHIERIHMRIKRFSCSYCGKGYYFRSELNFHLRSHSIKDNSREEEDFVNSILNLES